MRLFLIIFYFFQIFIKCYDSFKKNLIIGAIKNYTWATIEPFFISFKKANFKKCDCVIFVLDINKDTLEKLKSLGIIIKEFPEKYKGMKINNVRYKLYEEYLSDKLYKYNMVLHADVRDTFFQKDLFQLYDNKNKFLGFSLEEGNLNQSVNAEWMKNQYGDKIYEQIKNEKIICSGVIWGTVDKFYEFVKNIWEQIELKSPYKYSIHDQTATNYLIYYKKMFNDCIITNDIYNGSVMTIGLAKDMNFYFDSSEDLLNFNDKIKASAIHQYDRVPKIISIIKKKFVIQKEVYFNTTTVSDEIKIKGKNKRKIFVSKNSFIFLIISLLFILFVKKNLKFLVLYKINDKN